MPPSSRHPPPQLFVLTRIVICGIFTVHISCSPRLQSDMIISQWLRPSHKSHAVALFCLEAGRNSHHVTCSCIAPFAMYLFASVCSELSNAIIC